MQEAPACTDPPVSRISAPSVGSAARVGCATASRRVPLRRSVSTIPVPTAVPETGGGGRDGSGWGWQGRTRMGVASRDFVCGAPGVAAVGMRAATSDVVLEGVPGPVVIVCRI